MHRFFKLSYPEGRALQRMNSNTYSLVKRLNAKSKVSRYIKENLMREGWCQVYIDLRFPWLISDEIYDIRGRTSTKVMKGLKAASLAHFLDLDLGFKDEAALAKLASVSRSIFAKHLSSVV